MEELVKTFHIDYKLLIAQTVNFVIVFAVLYKFGLKPLMKIMEERSTKIEDGLKNAEVIEENLKDSEKQKQVAINEGRKQAQDLVSKADKDAETLRQEKVEKTRTESGKVVKAAKAEIARERDTMMQDLKAELGSLVVRATNKITNQTLDQKQHETLIKEAIAELEA